MLDDDDFDREFDHKTPMQRYAWPVGGAVFVVAGGALAFTLLHGRSGPAPRPHNEPHITQVQLPPPPPPPPPPKTPPPPKKAEETPKQREPTPQKAVVKPAPKAPSPPAAVQTSIAGNGPGTLGLGNGGGGDCVGSGCGAGDGSGGDNDGYYSNLVRDAIKSALSSNAKLRFARYEADVSFSIDAYGHPIGVRLANFSGDPDLRAEVERVLATLSPADPSIKVMAGREFTAHITERSRG